MSPNFSNLFAARLWERSGDYVRALAAVRRRPRAWGSGYIVMVPRHLREEGRLAAIVGDTAGAIKAYQHFLALRTKPDPGPLADEVGQVRRELAELVKGRQ
jgi:hypothetical protein